MVNKHLRASSNLQPPTRKRANPPAAQCPCAVQLPRLDGVAWGLHPFHKMKTLTVELSMPSGCVFTAITSSIDVRTEDGSIHISPREESHINMVHATELTLQTLDGPCVFLLENAVAGLKGRTFTVLAEHIRRIEPQTATAASNQLPNAFALSEPFSAGGARVPRAAFGAPPKQPTSTEGG